MPTRPVHTGGRKGLKNDGVNSRAVERPLEDSVDRIFTSQATLGLNVFYLAIIKARLL